ncbi:DUF262 domain-containing protein [Listeria booriae]|uniref:DUF262 domain-containing protein n=1 Tax=Listeria booriae TaxID=1552123 RepID=UPI00164E0215|nr:DUF262 domain-containing protein [Listeria booriae]MBC6128098.1 DUF262 domain-containing protein [Listeria booriae]
MEKKMIPRSVKQFKGMFEKTETMSFDHPIQRKGSQWNAYQKSLFVHSIAADFPIPALYATKIEKVYFILDGKQRMTTIFDFINGAFKLHDDTPLIDNFDATGMYFEELKEDIQDAILSRSISLYELEDATDEEIEDVFYRLNNGTLLTPIQKTKAKMGGELAKQFNELLSHEFLTNTVNLSKDQMKKEDDLKLIVQSIMVRDDEYQNIKSFVIGDVSKFAGNIKDDAETQILLHRMKSNFDYALLATDKKQKNMLKPIHIPMLIRTIECAMNKGIEVETFRNWFNDFEEQNKSKDTVYMQNCGAGSVGAVKVRGRVEMMEQSFNEYVKALEAFTHDQEI